MKLRTINQHHKSQNEDLNFKFQILRPCRQLPKLNSKLKAILNLRKSLNEALVPLMNHLTPTAKEVKNLRRVVVNLYKNLPKLINN